MVLFFFALLCFVLLLLYGLFFSRLLFEISGGWHQDEWHATFRVRAIVSMLEGYGTLRNRDARVGVRVRGVSLGQARVNTLGKKVTSVIKKRREKKRKRDRPRGGIYISLYWGFCTRLLRAFRDTFFRVEGTYGFDDPCFTGQVAGCLYGAEGVLQELFVQSRIDLHPDFVEGRKEGKSCFSFSLRIYRLIFPCLWYLTEARTVRR